ncbi:hypothetical protein MKMG_00247 [Methanogenium sp. MK-MG]|nr:hypothetical protein MKMG_00247 [Methanogenium sp. MK-MG]
MKGDDILSNRCTIRTNKEDTTILEGEKPTDVGIMRT